MAIGVISRPNQRGTKLDYHAWLPVISLGRVQPGDVGLISRGTPPRPFGLERFAASARPAIARRFLTFLRDMNDNRFAVSQELLATRLGSN